MSNVSLGISRNEYLGLANGELQEKQSKCLYDIFTILSPWVTESIANAGSVSTPIDFGDGAYVMYSFESCSNEHCGDTAGYLHAEYVDWEYRVFPRAVKLPHTDESLREAISDVTCHMWHGMSQILIDSDFTWRVVTENTKEEFDQAMDRIASLRYVVESVVRDEFVAALNTAIGEDAITFDHLEFVPMPFNIHGVDYENPMPKPNGLIEGYDVIAIMAHYNDSYNEKMRFIIKAEWTVSMINDEWFDETRIADWIRESWFEHIEFLPAERVKHKSEVHLW